ncbi:MAG: DNA-directed RNA polymerase subunit alpha [Anaerolineae bacterium]
MEPVLPKIEIDAISQQYGRFIISPLEAGYGTTLGNALRRVLLSSLPGAAVTSIKIDGVHHEFSSIEHVKEDTIELLLNIKQLRVRLLSDEPAQLQITREGEGIITAADIDCPPWVEIVNPELKLLTLDSKEAKVDIELAVEKGRGYSPAEERGELTIGEIPVDAIFSPIRKVGFNVERERVGQVTNFDRLVLEIWTDGTIRPQDALTESAEILHKLFSLISLMGEEPEEMEEEIEEEEVGIPPRIYEMPIEELGLTVRAFNCLKRAGITRVGEILDKLNKGEEEILAIRNFGQKSLSELYERLEACELMEYVQQAEEEEELAEEDEEDEEEYGDEE